MLLPLFILAIGMLFYRLAKKHRKPAWGYAFLGIGVFLVTPVLVGIILWLILSAVGGASIDAEFTAVFWAVLSDVVAIIVFYYLLKSAWSRKTQKKTAADLLDQ